MNMLRITQTELLELSIKLFAALKNLDKTREKHWFFYLTVARRSEFVRRRQTRV